MAVTKEWAEAHAIGGLTVVIAQLDVGVNADTWNTGLSDLFFWSVFDKDTDTKVTDVTGDSATGVLAFPTAGTNYIVFAIGR